MRVFFSLSSLVLTLSCAHGPVVEEYSSEELLMASCRAPGSDEPDSLDRRLEGTISISADSSELSGRFPADVSVSKNRLDIEITNPLGGTEARIRVRGSRYRVDIPNEREKSRSGRGDWAGVPVRWATGLFAGRIPCPSQRGLAAKSTQVKRTESALVVVTYPKSGKERFTYRFRKVDGDPWPESLLWQKVLKEDKGRRRVEFSFDHPSEEDLSPLYWKAQSEEGELEVRWRRREIGSSARESN